MNFRRWLRVGLLASLGLVATNTLPLAAQLPANLTDAVDMRSIGPTHQGGRFVDFAVIEAMPRIFYAATATGGLWKTTNNGITWTSIFDSQPVISLGTVAVSQSDTNIVYVGTGEANNSRSSYHGNGVYKSVNGGTSWTHVGLPESEHIGRIAIHPTDPNIVYVASLGKLYSETSDRGLYKSTNGGTSWTKVLDHRVDGRPIGVVDVQMDPTNPNILYAATYDKVRRPWTFGEGGPGGGIFKTTNGGATWTQLTGGLPTGLLGRIGISIFRKDPRTVYAVIENANSNTQNADERRRRMALGFGGNTVGDQMFRTDDAGRTWRNTAPGTPPPPPPDLDAPPGRGIAVGAAGAGAGAAGAGAAGAGGAGAPAAGARGAAGAADPAGGRGAGGRGGRGGGSAFSGANPPYYYAQVRVDPNDKEHVITLGVGNLHSTDGGRTWTSFPFSGGDNHALWINPKDSDHMLLGYDHGMAVTFDGGRTRFHPDNMPLAQFYASGYDMEVPYNVYGGIQDNGCAKGPSTMRQGNIPFEAWTRVGCADGFYNVVDPTDSRWLYNESQFGAISRTDQVTNTSQNITYPRGSTITPAPQPRWNWNAPILLSPHNPRVVYHGAQFLLRSPDRGDTWTPISPDLTVFDSTRRGGSGNVTYATITTIDESPLAAGLIWVGTDDGNVQVTKDGGRTWTNVRSRIEGHTGHWVSRVAASNHNPATAYVSVTGYRSDDHRPHVWKTTDYGQTWVSIVGNLPPSDAVNVIREDRKNPNLLFVGNDAGVFASLDGGRVWTRLRGGMPTNPVHDLHIHPRENEVIVATHGRGFFIGDITPLQGLTTQALAAEAALLDIQPAYQWATGQQTVRATLNYAGESRPAGVAINYYLRNAATGTAAIKVYDGSRLLAETTGPVTAGINTVRWNMQSRRELTQAEIDAAASAAAGAGGGRGRGGAGGGGGGGGGGGRGAGGGRGGAGPAAVVFPAGGGNAVMGTVAPGEYKVVLTVGGRDYTQKAFILADPGARKD